MSQIFNREIEKLKQHLIALFKLVESNFSLSCQALMEEDEGAAEEVFNQEKEVNSKKVELQEECFKIVALHQPVAFDLRFIMATLKFANDLERIGDLAVGIANRTIALKNLPMMEAPFKVYKMADHVHSMMSCGLNALINLDRQQAVEVMKNEDAVDEMHRHNLQVIKKRIVEQPEHIDALVNYLSVSRYLERIADHVTNLGEEVVYIVDGDIVTHLNSKYD
ncbi:MAG: phosphate signaling complex protein PhoU [Desulfurivibrio sp.]|nr:phosphate signaling complex protein PhoU [Desulfurivibrio sp.]